MTITNTHMISITNYLIFSVVIIVSITQHHVLVVQPFSLQPRLSTTTTSRSSSSLKMSSDAFDAVGLGLPMEFCRVCQEEGWMSPTAIQRLAIPAILKLSKEDCEYNSIWSEAPTGSGKTGAYALPLIDMGSKVRRQRQITKSDALYKPSTLIIVPTRELAKQIESVFVSLCSHLPPNRRISSLCIHGGVPLEPQISRLASSLKKQALDVVIATPGRLVDVLGHEEKQDPHEAALERRLLAALDEMGTLDATLTLNDIQEGKLDRRDDEGRGGIRNVLGGLTYLVLDEADRLLGRGFAQEMGQLLAFLPRDRQLKTMLFSATFPTMVQPRVERLLARLGGRDAVPLTLTVSSTDDMTHTMTSQDASTDDMTHTMTSQDDTRDFSKSHGHGTPVMPATSLTDTIHLRNIRIDDKRRTQALIHLIDKNSSTWDIVLVFVSTRYTSEHISRKLRRKNIRSTTLHGKLTQEERTTRWERFKAKKIKVLIATDIASRGLDVLGLPCVLNYDLPRSTADFTHRIGRTGRAGRKGTAVTFITPRSEAHFDLIEMRHFGGSMPVEREILKGFEFDETLWAAESRIAKLSVPGKQHSDLGLAHDKMYGGVKGRRKSKKDKLREKAARDHHHQNQEANTTTATTNDHQTNANNSSTTLVLLKENDDDDHNEENYSLPVNNPLLLDYDQLTVVALKEKLRERGMKVTGKKDELIQRLMQS